MALVTRSARRGGIGRRWLVIGLVITLFVLLVDASLHSRSPGPGDQLATGAWVDRALPLVTASSETGHQLAAVWSDGLQTPPATLAAQLAQIAAGASSDYRQSTALRPPADLAGPAGLLDACLLSRSDAAAAVRNALEPLLAGHALSSGSNGAGGVITAIQTAGEDMQIGDQAYRLFLQSLPNVGIPMPDSAWATNMSPYQPGSAQVFLTSLQSALSATPVHQVRIDSVTTSPGAVEQRGNVQVLPDSAAMSVTVVLSDVGNQPEKGMTVTASVAPGGGSSSVRDFVDLAPGQAVTVQGMGPLDPPQGVAVTLTVTVTPPAGSPTPSVSRALVFMMPSPASPTTTARTG